MGAHNNLNPGLDLAETISRTEGYMLVKVLYEALLFKANKKQDCSAKKKEGPRALDRSPDSWHMRRWCFGM